MLIHSEYMCRIGLWTNKNLKEPNQKTEEVAINAHIERKPLKNLKNP